MRHWKTKRCGRSVHIVIADDTADFNAQQTMLDERLGCAKIKGAQALTYRHGKSLYMLFNAANLDVEIAAHEVHHMIISLPYKSEERAAGLAGVITKWIAEKGRKR